MGNDAQAKQASTILVVDDSPTVLRVAEFVLARAGYPVVCLDSGARVVEVSSAERPALILLNMAMPDIGGHEICRALGEDPVLESIPIVVMNNRGETMGDRFIREIGIVDHISKPFAPEALLAVVEHTLDKIGRADVAPRRRMPQDTVDLTEEVAGPAAKRLAVAIVGALGEASVQRQEDAGAVRRVLESPEITAELDALLLERPHGPALCGDLRTIPVAETLQVLSLQRQSGFLRIRHGETTITIALKDGAVRLVTGETLREEFLLGNILVQEKLMEARELEVLLQIRKGTRRRLGTQLVKLGYLSREQLHHALRRQSAELIYELLRWGTGRLSFEPHAELPEEVLEFEFGLSISELLMEGFRRVDEWGLIEDAIPSFDVILRQVPGGVAHTGPKGLTKEEQEVLLRVDGHRTVQEIIDQVGWGTFAVARILYRLTAARVVTTQEPEAPADEASDS